MTSMQSLILAFALCTTTLLYTMEETSRNIPYYKNFAHSIIIPNPSPTIREVIHSLQSIANQITQTDAKETHVKELLHTCNHIHPLLFYEDSELYKIYQVMILNTLNDITIHLMNAQMPQLALDVIQKTQAIDWKEYAANFNFFYLSFQVMEREVTCLILEKKHAEVTKLLESQKNKLLLAHSAIQKIVNESLHAIGILHRQLYYKQITNDDFIASYMHHHRLIDAIQDPQIIQSVLTKKIYYCLSKSFSHSINSLLKQQHYRHALLLTDQISSLTCTHMTYLQKINYWEFLHNQKNHIVDKLVEKKRSKAFKKFNASFNSPAFSSQSLCKKFSHIPSWINAVPLHLQVTIKSKVLADFHGLSYYMVQQGNLKTAEEIINYALLLPFTNIQTSYDKSLQGLLNHVHTIKESSKNIAPKMIFADNANNPKRC